MERMMRYSLLTGLVALAFAGAAAQADEPLEAAPATVGLAQDRLDRFAPLIQAHLAKDQLAGAVVLIARRGKIAYLHSFGMADKAAARPMAPDTLFRLYSMTKPIVAVAAMMLYEQGKFDLRDPVSDYIPEFADMKVGVTRPDPKTGKAHRTLEPAQQAITVLDLLRHTAGLGYYYSTDDKGQPYYHPYGVDVVGRLIEIWSGQPLDQYLAEQVFKPLGMVDTGFYVPEDKLDRLAVLYTPYPLGKTDAEGILGLGGPIVPVPGGQQDYFKHKPILLSGGGGLVSTALDYGRFSMMLANGGALDGVRLLSPKTVDLIGADLLGDRPRGTVGPWQGDGFGLTLEISGGPAATGTIASKGEYDWGGVAGTSMFVDPQEKLVGVLMMQVIPGSPYWGRMLRQLGTQAIVEEERR